MRKIPRFRMFAGPNGSGKTTFYLSLIKSEIIKTDIYVSADSIEEKLKEEKFIDLKKYNVQITEQDFRNYILDSTLYHKSGLKKNDVEKIYLKDHKLIFDFKKINSYHASFIATYLVEKLFLTRQSFCFETVMSHPSKVHYLRLAKDNGYKTYLYFLFTNKVSINIKRIKYRVLQGKHNVSSTKVRDRFHKSLENLKEANSITDTAYIINNSSQEPVIEYHKIGDTIVDYSSQNSLIHKYIYN